MQECSEAELIALEASPADQIVAPKDLIERVVRDLEAIRSADPSMEQVGHQPPWVPGQLIISGLEQSSLDRLKDSKYGPIETQSISTENTYLVTFVCCCYHPVRLAGRLQEELDIKNAEPNNIIGGSSSITLTGDVSGTNQYVFYMGSGDCPSGCIDRRYVTYQVTPSGVVTLIKDEGSGSNGSGWSNV